MKKYYSFRLFAGKVSFLIDKKATRTILFLMGLTAMVFIISTGLGDFAINPFTTISMFFGGGTDMEQLVVFQFRLPRIIVSLLAGMSLAVAGGLLQGIIRNPLASPDIIGLTAGAGTAVMAFLWIFSNNNHSLYVSIQWLPIAAFIGATIVALVVYLLSWRNGVTPIRLVLIGIGLSALMQAATTMFMILGPIYQASQANIWMIGSVNNASWENVWFLLPSTTILLVIAFISSRNVNVQELGEDVATGVGSYVQKHRFMLLFISTALVGGAVAFAGGIGFVGLMAPHMARRLVGSSFGALLPTSAFIGALLVMLADLVGRTLFLPIIIPAGVFTAGIGAPYYIYLLIKTKNG
ncbi:iron ABC transporter permease [Bacillus spongiae]|uniref:Iron ABC transporter permease n=1 Tax=Bacillus spongiae TaxID=2683610 RepID=A0ABU8HA10_9BACI